tara:strand:- start:1 stop:921 length:921 start_codon:yes stop_codon:yes gene_type:complete
MEQEQAVEETVEIEVADPSIKEQQAQEVEVVQPEQQSVQTEQKEEQTDTKEEQKEDELESYSKNVQARIKKLTEKYRKEERDREEAVRISQKLLEENKKLKQRVDSLDQGYLSEYGTRLESQEDQAKRAYAEAHQAGDSEKMFEAQKALSKIAIEQERYRLAKDQSEKKEKEKGEESAETVAETPQPQQKVSPKAKDWAEKNEWFGDDEIMTQAAFVVHNKLIQEEGFDPESDEYYSEIDRRMRQEFPHKFEKQKTSSGVQVASANSTASRNTQQKRRSVKLSPSQIAIAKKLGVPLEEYAKYVKD